MKGNINIYVLFLFVYLSSFCRGRLKPSSNSQEEVINVHIIPHTHDDAGWLWSLDDYYSGTNPGNKCVKCILDNMLTSLTADPQRTFTYVEMAFFEKWYSEQSESTKKTMKNLVKEGRLDFANAGWVMNDEATSHYQHIIDQMRLGMLFLKRELNYTPRIAWSIDPFGHSLTNAYLFNKLGFDKLVMVRIDFREKEKRIKEKTMEFNWRPYFQIDKGHSSIMTHITHGHYSPDGDRFPNLLETDYNKSFDFKLGSIYSYFKDMSDAYPTRELMFLFGDDFTFANANQNFKNIEAMMKAFKSNAEYKDKINFFYSTPTKYFNSLNSKLNKDKITLQSLDGFDFFPYSEFKLDYWTGYFTSRPYLKGLVRDAGVYLENFDKLLLNQLLSNKTKLDLQPHLDNVDVLRRQLGIAQHHDAVSGTAREAVSTDYIKRLTNGIDKVTESTRILLEKDLNTFVKGNFESVCIEAASQSECNLKVFHEDEVDKGMVLVYINPGIEGKYPIKIKVEINKSNKGVIITNFQDNSQEIPSDLICDSDLELCVMNAIIDFAKDELYRIVKIKTNEKNTAVSASSIPSKSQLTLVNNSKSSLVFDTEKLTFLQKVNSTGEEYFITITHGYYEYHSWKDPAGKNRQGAYLMATDEETPKKFSCIMDKSKFFIGKTLSEVDLVFEKSKLKLRIYHSLNAFNFVIDTESVLFPNHPENGFEFLLIINSNVDNLNPRGETEFFTDTNGMRMVKRIKNTRETFDFKVDDKVASNFYPVNSLLSLKSEKDNEALNVFNDRPQSASSLTKGEIFFVLNRWSQKDDRKGLADGIDEFNSSNINFHVNHWVAFTNNEYDKKFLSNFINKKPLYAVYTDITDSGMKEESSKLFLKEIDKKALSNESIFSIEDKYCVEYNLYFISKEKLLVQFMNKYDPYLYPDKSCKVEVMGEGESILSVKRMNLNGIDEIYEQ